MSIQIIVQTSVIKNVSEVGNCNIQNTVEPRSIVFQGDGEKNDECGKTINPENYYTL